jgi:hypothetical protein
VSHSVKVAPDRRIPVDGGDRGVVGELAVEPGLDELGQLVEVLGRDDLVSHRTPGPGR